MGHSTAKEVVQILRTTFGCAEQGMIFKKGYCFAPKVRKLTNKVVSF